MNFGYSTSFLAIDKGLIEQCGPTGFASQILNYSFNFTGFQTGYLYHTIYTFVFCMILLFGWYFFVSFGLIISSVVSAQFVTGLFGFFLLSLSLN